MSFRVILDSFLEKMRSARPFLRTKIGSRLALLGILDFILLFFAPAIRGFVGTALFGCALSVFLVLIWRYYHRESAIVPAVLLCIPLTLDLLIYSIAKAGDSDTLIGIITALLVTIAALLLAARTPVFGFIDKINDSMYAFLGAGAACAVVVIAAWILNIIVVLSWWILCIIAFLVVAGVFAGLVYSTAAYTASDGRRQARKRRSREAQKRRYEEYRPRSRETKIYNAEYRSRRAAGDDVKIYKRRDGKIYNVDGGDDVTIEYDIDNEFDDDFFDPDHTDF